VNANGYALPDNQAYQAAPPCDNYYQIRDDIVVTLEKLGIPVKYHHHEVGGPGQSEIETPLLGITEAGDAALLVKYVVKMTAMRAGKTATFLPKPIYGLAGSSTHYHQLLTKNGANQFYDPNGLSLLSQTALQYIGGLLTHAPAVMAFTNPSPNSYRRLVPVSKRLSKLFFHPETAAPRSAFPNMPQLRRPCAWNSARRRNRQCLPFHGSHAHGSLSVCFAGINPTEAALDRFTTTFLIGRRNGARQ
jgi:hypothetical protein